MRTELSVTSIIIQCIHIYFGCTDGLIHSEQRDKLSLTSTRLQFAVECGLLQRTGQKFQK